MIDPEFSSPHVHSLSTQINTIELPNESIQLYISNCKTYEIIRQYFILINQILF